MNLTAILDFTSPQAIQADAPLWSDVVWQPGFRNPKKKSIIGRETALVLFNEAKWDPDSSQASQSDLKISKTTLNCCSDPVLEGRVQPGFPTYQVDKGFTTFLGSSVSWWDRKPGWILKDWIWAPLIYIGNSDRGWRISGYYYSKWETRRRLPKRSILK